MRILLATLCVLLLASPVLGKGEAKQDGAKVWTLRDTVDSALRYSPSLKSEAESVRMQQETVKEAKAGHLPRLDVQARGGAATLPVSRYD